MITASAVGWIDPLPNDDDGNRRIKEYPAEVPSHPMAAMHSDDERIRGHFFDDVPYDAREIAELDCIRNVEIVDISDRLVEPRPYFDLLCLSELFDDGFRIGFLPTHLIAIRDSVPRVDVCRSDNVRNGHGCFEQP